MERKLQRIERRLARLNKKAAILELILLEKDAELYGMTVEELKECTGR